MPLPLLYGHDWDAPCGQVTKVTIAETKVALWFEARIVDGGLPWAQEVWGHLKSGRLPAVSVFSNFLYPCTDRPDWELQEISVCEDGACDDALIHVVKSVAKPGIVFADRPREIIHRDVRKGICQ